MDFTKQAHAYARRISNELIPKTGRDNYTEIFDAFMAGVTIATQPVDIARMHYMSELSTIVIRPIIKQKNHGINFNFSNLPETVKTYKPWWKVLGLDEFSPEEHVKPCYRELVNKYHPDNKETGNRSKFLEIQNAYNDFLNENKSLS